MNDKDLHTLLSGLKDAQPVLPEHQARIRALLLDEHTRQQTSRLPLSAFIRQVMRGMIMKSPLTSPLVVTAGIILLTGTASAAAFWFKTNVSSSTHGNTVSISAKDCPAIPASQAKAMGTSLPSTYSFDEKYQIVDSSQISSEQIAQAARAKCEQRAIAAGINEAFPDMQEFSASNLSPSSRGLYFPIYLSGTVKAVQGNEVTIDNLSSNSAQASTATMRLADDALITRAGKKLNSIKPGDVVYFAYQNRAVADETPSQTDLASLRKTTDPGERSIIRGIGVMSTDAQALQKLQHAIESGAVKTLRSDPLRG